MRHTLCLSRRRMTGVAIHHDKADGNVGLLRSNHQRLSQEMISSQREAIDQTGFRYVVGKDSIHADGQRQKAGETVKDRQCYKLHVSRQTSSRGGMQILEHEPRFAFRQSYSEPHLGRLDHFNDCSKWRCSNSELSTTVQRRYAQRCPNETPRRPVLRS